MTAPTQAQLDEFARRLRALEAEFEELKRLAVVETVEPEAEPIPAVPPRSVPKWLVPVRQQLDAGDAKAALRELERLRAHALRTRSISELEEILELLQTLPISPAVQRLAYAIAQNVAHLRRAAPAEPEEPAPAPPPRVLPEWLAHVPALLEAGNEKAALRELERLRGQALRSRSVPRLEQILALLETAPTTPAVQRLAYAVAQNLAFVRRSGTAEHAGPPRFRPPQLEASDLLGPRALAIAGGVVTLLGIVFFFVLAVNRGWIGPRGRIALGGGASLIVFAAGLELRRRFGATHAALAAVGAGIAGGYATLLSAAALYDLLPDYAALLVAAAIASIGLATSLRWRSQIVAGIGLVGAILVPVAIIAQGELSALGTAFAAVVFAAAATVAARLDWRGLLIASALASAPQIVALVAQDKYAAHSPWRIILVAAAFSTLYVYAGIVHQLRAHSRAFGQFVTTFTLGGGGLAAGAALRLFATTEQRGFALLAIGAAYAAAATFFFHRAETRDLSALLTFAALTLGAFALARLLSGQPLAFAWAGEVAALAWLAPRAREIRFQLWSAAYLTLVLVHVLAFDAPPRRLYVETAHPAAGAPAVLAFAAAAAVFAYYARPWRKVTATVFRTTAAWIALVSVVYAASLGVIAISSSFDWAWVAIAGLWSVVGLGLLGAGQRRGAIAWLGVATLLVVDEGFHTLGQPARSWAFVVVGAAVFATGVVAAAGKRTPELDAVTGAGALAGVALFCYPIAALLDGRAQGLALLGPALLYAAVATALFRRGSRDTAAVFWSIGLTVAAVADARILTSTLAVLGWALAGVGLAWLARRVAEPRLQIGAAGFVLLTLGRAIVVQAPPTHLFVAGMHPGHGSASLLIAAGAAAAYAALSAGRDRLVGAWAAAVFTVYALSLLILELVLRVSSADLHTEFQRGHTAVSAFWGVLGLSLLYAGLKRQSRALRLAGLSLFVVSLGKVFLYDLPSLSSITRALSFLAVGAVLLLGGFFYQRLGARPDAR